MTNQALYIFFLAAAVYVNGHVYAMLGSDAELRCRVETQERLMQVLWERREDLKIEAFLLYKRSDQQAAHLTPFAKNRVVFLPNGDHMGNIRIRNVTLADEGTYTCSFTTFPSGTQEREIQLEILVEPTITVYLPPVVSQTDPKNVAECTAAAAKPAAQIHWIINGSARASNDTTILHSNGTVTTKSQLWMEPSLRLLGTQATCFISQSNGKFQQERNITLDNILYPPVDLRIIVHEIAGSKLSLECQANANPTATYKWKRDNGSSTDVTGHQVTQTLTLSTSDLHESDLYICEAENIIGRTEVYIYLLEKQGVLHFGAHLSINGHETAERTVAGSCQSRSCRLKNSGPGTEELY
ncbi:nectin-1-like [Pelodytes ibericus]